MIVAVVCVSFIALVALVLAAALVEHVRAQARTWDRKEREFGTERRELVDRLMFMSGQTWNPPPVETVIEPDLPAFDFELPDLEPIE